MVPGTGIEPVLPCGKRILSPLRLPVPPPRRCDGFYQKNGGDTRIRTGGEGFADPCLATWLCRLWSGKRGSNPRPSAWEADALPTELFPQPIAYYSMNPPDAGQ